MGRTTQDHGRAGENEELEWLKQMAMGGSGFSLPPVSDSAKQALELILPQFCPTHRMLLRQTGLKPGRIDSTGGETNRCRST